MGFENFGTVSFTTEAKTVDFISYLEQGKVMATKCTKCGTTYFLPKLDSPQCIDSETEWFEITGKGKMLTHTIVQ